MKHIPLCWKCSKRIVIRIEDNPSGFIEDDVVAFTFVGCREDDRIRDYEDAKKLCACLPKEDNDDGD